MDVLLKVLQIAAPVFILAFAGFVWVRLRLAYDVGFVTRLSMQFAMPCLIFTALARAKVDETALADLAIATLISYFCVAVFSLAACQLLRLDLRSMLSPIIFGNTGNIGLPITLFAYGEQGLAYALVIFAVMAILNFTLGVWIVSGEGSREMLRQPLVYGALLGGAALVWHWQPPDWAMNTLSLIGQIAIPLMLLTLGVAVARLSVRDIGRAMVISLIKLAIGLGVGVGVVAGMGLGFGAEGGALILQLMMPVAVTSYLLATRYEAEPEAVAGLVVASTLLAVIAVPAVLAVLV